MAFERFTDDLLVEILSRIPAMSLRRLKCVSKHWLYLIDHPDHRKKLRQTLAGFIYTSSATGELLTVSSFRFTSLSRGCRAPLIDTSFAFLPNHQRVDLLDCCSGLLLCRWYAAGGDECRYIVCNPLRKEWIMLPEPNKADNVSTVRLGFDPAASSHFYVFMLLEEIDGDFYLYHTRVNVYSSETGRWARKEKRWDERIFPFGHQLRSTVFLNGCMHFHAYSFKSYDCLVAVDTEGETWTIFRLPPGLFNGFLHQSHGCLHYSTFLYDADSTFPLVVYVLKDYDKKEWMLKHSIVTGCTQRISHRWMAIHPECDLIFFTEGQDTKFMSMMCYNMDRQQVKEVSNLEYGDPPYLPYVPFYAALQSLHS
ncbi:hypothetical protein ACQJBY_066653 [Aegilops geniculata]